MSYKKLKIDGLYVKQLIVIQIFKEFYFIIFTYLVKIKIKAFILTGDSMQYYSLKT